MNTYGRNGRVETPENNIENPALPPEEGAEEEKGIRIDGFQQVIEMLEIAEPEFRDSLLARIMKADREMGLRLERALAERIS